VKGDVQIAVRDPFFACLEGLGIAEVENMSEAKMHLDEKSCRDLKKWLVKSLREPGEGPLVKVHYHKDMPPHFDFFYDPLTNDVTPWEVSEQL